ncbi:SHOCT domain-containing protein [Natrialbaceae archaeon A-CW1-1]
MLGFLAFATLGALGVGWIGYAIGVVAAIGLACLLPMLVTSPVLMRDATSTQGSLENAHPTPLERASAAKSDSSNTDRDGQSAPTSTVDAQNRPTVVDVYDLLRERYARGELSDEQFEQKLERLLETDTLEASRALIEQAHADEERPGRIRTAQSATTDRQQRLERGSK